MHTEKTTSLTSPSGDWWIAVAFPCSIFVRPPIVPA